MRPDERREYVRGCEACGAPAHWIVFTRLSRPCFLRGAPVTHVGLCPVSDSCLLRELVPQPPRSSIGNWL